MAAGYGSSASSCFGSSRPCAVLGSLRRGQISLYLRPESGSREPTQESFQGLFKGQQLDRERLAALGFGAFAAYGVISNVNAGVLITIAWLSVVKSTGQMPLAPGNWPPFLAIYAGKHLYEQRRHTYLQKQLHYMILIVTLIPSNTGHAPRLLPHPLINNSRNPLAAGLWISSQFMRPIRLSLALGAAPFFDAGLSRIMRVTRIDNKVAAFAIMLAAIAATTISSLTLAIFLCGGFPSWAGAAAASL